MPSKAAASYDSLDSHSYRQIIFFVGFLELFLEKGTHVIPTGKESHRILKRNTVQPVIIVGNWKLVSGNLLGDCKIHGLKLF